MNTRSLKILILNYEFPPLGGGASPVSYEIAQQYIKQGHTVTVVTMGFKGLLKKEILNGIRIYRVPSIRARKELCSTHEMLTYIISACWFLRKHLKANTYDVCHTHFAIPTGPVAVWCKKKFDLNYILTSHGSDIPGFNSDRFTLIHTFTSPFLRHILKKASTITTPSQFLKNLIIKNVNTDLEKKITVLPNGAKDMRRPGYTKKNIVFSSGRLLQRKGFDLLINAFTEVNNEEWELHIVGDGPHMSKLKQLAQNNNKIHFTGWLDNTGEHYLKIINEAKIFSLLSQSESQGIVFIEAMSTGCAVLSSDTTACRETVSPEIGLLVNRNSPDMIANALKTLMTGQEKMNSYMKNSRHRYEKYYQYEAIGLKYNKILQSVATQNEE